MELLVFTEPQLGATYDDQLAFARAAAEGGFAGYFRSDHYLAMGSRDGLPGSTDAWTTLAGLARETSGIRLGTLVSPVTFRHPGPLAITVAQVDAMSGGRVELGIGAGWFEKEHRAYAIPFPSTGERFARLEEQLTIISGLWTTPVGESFSFAGAHYSVDESPGLPKPVQAPHPPIVIGGAGPTKTPRLVARFATEYNAPFHTPDKAREAFARARAACEAVGRDPSTLRLSAAVTACCGSDDAEVERRAGRIGQPVENLRKWAAGGTPAEVVDRIGAFADAGAERVYLQFIDLQDVDHVRLVGADVVPAFAGR